MTFSISFDGTIPDRLKQPAYFSSIEIHPAEFKDVAQIPLLFHGVYGFSYSQPCVYEASEFAGMISKGEIISVVAATHEGRVIGHCALIKENAQARIASAGMSVVNYDFRNRGYESRMLAALIHKARKGHFWGISSDAVTSHVYAQLTGQKFGFRRVGLMVGKISDRRTYDGSYPAPGRRQSTACGFLPMRDDPAIEIYPPDHHRDFIDMLVGRAGLKRKLSYAGARHCRPLDEQALVRTRVIDNDIAHVRVHDYGLDIFPAIDSILQEFKAKDIHHITLCLPLTSPFTAIACEEFEKSGFFIAGIMPHTLIGDALALQYLHNVCVDYDDILTASETLSDIKSYVYEHDPKSEHHETRHVISVT